MQHQHISTNNQESKLQNNKTQQTQRNSQNKITKYKAKSLNKTQLPKTILNQASPGVKAHQAKNKHLAKQTSKQQP